MKKKNLIDVVRNINSLTDIDKFDEMLFDLKNFEIITYKEYIILLDALYERKEQIF